MSASKLQAQDKDNSHFFQLIRKIQGFPDPVSEYWEALCDTYKSILIRIHMIGLLLRLKYTRDMRIAMIRTKELKTSSMKQNRKLPEWTIS